MANPYTDQAPGAGWQEVVLTDNVSMIFTALIRNSADDFKSTATFADFQMLVLENGHVGSEASTTPYFFFVELS